MEHAPDGFCSLNVIYSHPTMARLTGTGPFILNFYEVEEEDPLIVVNFYGVNPASVEVASAGKERGVKLITVNSHSFAKQVPKSFRWRTLQRAISTTSLM